MPRPKREGRASLKLVGDFTKGGDYVQAGRKIDNVDIRELSMWVRNPDADRLHAAPQRRQRPDASDRLHQDGAGPGLAAGRAAAGAVLRPRAARRTR